MKCCRREGRMEGKGAEKETKKEEKMMMGKKGEREKRETVKDGESEGEGG